MKSSCEASHRIRDRPGVGVVCLALLILCFRSGAAYATNWAAHHGMTSAQYQERFNFYNGLGYRLRQVSGYEVAGQARYAAVWDQTDGPIYNAVHGLTSAQYQAHFNARVADGYRLVHVSGYDVGGIDYYAAIFELRSGPIWAARHRMTFSQYQQAFDDFLAQGYRLVDVSGYQLTGQDYYAAIWEQTSGPQWAARHNMTSSQYQAEFDALASQGFRLVDVSGYQVAGQSRYAAIWEQSDLGQWAARHGLSFSQYQDAFDDFVANGYRLVHVSGHGLDRSGADFYAGIWEKPLPTSDYPIAGDLLPGLEVFDDAMLDYMASRGITSGTLAISRNGNLVLERAYGWKDEGKSTELAPDALLRLASVVKPFVAAAIKELIADGSLQASDRVFCLTGSPVSCVLNITPAGMEDPQAIDITVQHLLDHEGGFNSAVSGDPMFMPFEIADALGISSPPAPVDIARYMLGQALDSTPGTEYAYSNYGFMLLGLIIEEISGVSVTAFLQSEVFAAAGIPGSEVELGRTLPDDRNAREPWYDDPGYSENVFDRDEFVPWPDGGFYLEAMESHGGLIATARAVTQYLDQYLISGDTNPGGPVPDATFFGSLPGTWTMARQRSDSINIGALFNRRGTNEEEIKDLLDAAADSLDWSVLGCCLIAPAPPTIIETEAVNDNISLTVMYVDNGSPPVSQIDASCTDGQSVISGSSSSTLVSIDGAIAETSYTCTVTATNSIGTSAASAPSQPITPEFIPEGLGIWLLLEALE